MRSFFMAVVSIMMAPASSRTHLTPEVIMSSYKELLNQIEALKQQAETIRNTEFAEVIADIRAKMA